MLTGKQLINGQWVGDENLFFQAINPANNKTLSGEFSDASDEQINEAATVASNSFAAYSALPDKNRAEFLETIASELEAFKVEIIERCVLETGLPEMRVQGELGRTTGQLRMFAGLLMKGEWKRPVIDKADPDRKPVPKPDVRLTQIPLGPVVVFSASNFPLAFSTAGGDTASALAAGCPVIVKAHTGHPGTSELVAQCIKNAIGKCDVPKGVFGLLHGRGTNLGTKLVQHPKIKAVGFTGSVAGGHALYNLAVNRPEPIPFYGELGSTNPVFLLNNSLTKSAEQIAENFITSLNMGAGQFCTSPGLIIACKGEGLDRFLSKSAECIVAQPTHTMLTQEISDSYLKQNKERIDLDAITMVAKNTVDESSSNQAVVQLTTVNAKEYLNNKKLQEEVFGPSALVVICDDNNEMLTIAQDLFGHLTGAVFHESEDDVFSTSLLAELQHKVGRVLFNGFGTGVEVCAGMSHGGPSPSSTCVQTTSVGARAIERFVRPVCFQNTPDSLLPIELKNSNPLNLLRLVDNVLTNEGI